MNDLHFIKKPILFVAIIVLAVSLAGCAASEATPLATPPPSVAVTPSTAMPPATSTSPSIPALPPTPPLPAASAPALTPSPISAPPPAEPPSPPISASPAPTPVPLSTPAPTPTAIYTPAAAPFSPNPAQLDLMNYVLDLINKDRVSDGLNKVDLSFNTAAQQHAQDMLDNQYIAHWGTDGQKPYMRYTEAGGLNKEGENSDGLFKNSQIDVKAELQKFEVDMMAEGPGGPHHDNILNKWHKKVSIGIAYNNSGVALVQQFEGNYLEYYQPPTITGNIFSLSGKFTQSGIVLNSIAVTFDGLPQCLTGQQLMDGPYHIYGLGKTLGYIQQPLPPGLTYTSLPPNSIIGTSGNFDQSGQFSIQADISSFLAQGKGVYTIVLIAQSGKEAIPFSNYSIFIK